MNIVKMIPLSVALPLLLVGPASGSNQPIFPGAVGFGIDTKAGTDGTVIRVTNLKPGGPGSLRAAIEAKGPRLVVFEVGGVIDLNKSTLTIAEPYITIAGQTAPSPGITIIRGGISVKAHDVLIQHIRVRPGDAGEPKRSGWEPDGLSTNAAYNVVIDHCSFTWAVDENLSASGPRLEGPEATSRRITFSNCLIAEALHDSSHEKGPHSKGTLIHDFCQDIAIIGNLYAHNHDRNPYFKAHTTGVIVNNLIYNPGSAAVLLNYSPGEWTDARFDPEIARVSVVGNVMVQGDNTPPALPMVGRMLGSAFMDDNLAFDRSGAPAPLVDARIIMLDERPVWPDGLKPLPAHAVVEHVLANAGARPWDRDAIDQRIVRDFQERKGRIIDSQEEVGGYPDMEETRHELSVPETRRRQWLAGFERRERLPGQPMDDSEREYPSN